MGAGAQGLFVTGTDTGVGKTLVACALLHAFAASGRSVIGMKPVAAGREDGRFHDVSALAEASNVRAAGSLVNPYAFDPPIAPHIAAGLAGVSIRLDALTDAYAGLSALADVVVVEGAGGYMIPLNEHQTSADMARLLGLPVVLVVGMRLGCLNHALLTRQAIAASGLDCAGWVANCIDADMLHLDENVAALAQRMDCPMLGRVPFDSGWKARDLAPLLSLGSLLGSGPRGRG